MKSNIILTIYKIIYDMIYTLDKHRGITKGWWETSYNMFTSIISHKNMNKMIGEKNDKL